MTSKTLDYDADIIREFAAKLYLRARSLAAVYTLIGTFLGGLVGGATASENPIALWLSILMFGIIGYMIGREKAFAMKLEAQTALAQVQIEMNTRPVQQPLVQ